MWKIKYIACENFISFQKAELDIPQNVCTLIYGLNNDNMQQRNNGTGKSSIIEAIAFALTGEPLRSVDKVEEIINDSANTAHVYMELSNDYDNIEFTIDRTINRKLPQTIECHKYDANDNEVDKDRTSQPTVLDYNRYILEEIGLTKDDIYSNFILSNSKYKSFFDASDKAKKAMINRFSGADKIDEIIDKLHQDRLPAEEELNKAKDKKIAVEAKLEVVDGQLADADSKKAEWVANKERRIADITNQIVQKREELRGVKELITRADNRLKAIGEVDDYIEDELVESKDGLANIYKKIVSLFEMNKLDTIKDYVAISESYEKTIVNYSEQERLLNDELCQLEKSVNVTETALNEAQKKSDKLQSETEVEDKETLADIEAIKKDIETAKAKNGELVQDIATVRANVDDVEEKIHQLQHQIRGAITCPKCHHEFFVEGDITLEEAKAQLVSAEKELKNYQFEKSKLEKELEKGRSEQAGFEKELVDADEEIRQRANVLSEIRRKVRNCNAEFERVSAQVTEVKRKLNAVDNDIYLQRAKIGGLIKNMIDEAFDIIDYAYERGKNYIKTQKDKCTSINASIESFEKAIEEVRNSSQDDFVASLNESKAKYEKELAEAINELDKAQKEYDKYVVQENHFADFRSYLANKKVKAISAVTNHFLDLIGSDLRVEMLGYKKLKSGKVRDKITVNLLRNGVDCGSYAKFSGGERARVNLASILGLQKLTNNSAPKGKGLDLLILDEILEASDTTGIESSCKALNKLRATSLLVTQNPISDNDGNAIVVVKENGYSTIKE